MKRSPRKLTLNRETLCRLNEENLATVAGASGTTCDPTLQTMCFVCPGTRSICYSDCDTCKTC